jgi:hypothetical protein
MNSAIDGVAPSHEVIPSALLEAVDTLLETAPCDCSHKRRHEKGEHMSHCYLFDLNIVRNKMLAAGVPARETNTPESRDSQHVLKAEAARPDATDREIPGSSASPSGGSMGVGQPAAAGPNGVALDSKASAAPVTKE